MHTRAASRLSVVALLASLALAAGCTHSGDSPDRPETGDSPAASAPVSPDESDAPSATPPASTSTGKPLLDRLLPTDLVPGLNSEWHWQDGDTGTPPVDPFGRCAKADLLSIGATEAVERTYFPPDDSDDNAAEQIAEFPDASTAARAWSVLGAWHKRCGKVADAPRVGEMVSVPVDQGTARWYLLSRVLPDEENAEFEAFGMVLSGTRIAVLRMVSIGQDYDYPAGQEPMVGMVTAAAGWLR